MEPSEGGEGRRAGVLPLGTGWEGPRLSEWVEPQGELLAVQVSAVGREREAGKPMRVKLQRWHWGRKTAGLPWIPAAAEEL